MGTDKTKKRGRGAPKKPQHLKSKLQTVSLKLGQIEHAKQIGNGSISRGVAKALEQYDLDFDDD